MQRILKEVFADFNSIQKNVRCQQNYQVSQGQRGNVKYENLKLFPTSHFLYHLPPFLLSFFFFLSPFNKIHKIFCISLYYFLHNFFFGYLNVTLCFILLPHLVTCQPLSPQTSILPYNTTSKFASSFH